MIYNNRNFVILTAEEAEGINYSQVLVTSADTLRWNEDNTKTVIKYEGSKPSFLYGKDVLTHSQVLTELEKSEWSGEWSRG